MSSLLVIVYVFFEAAGCVEGMEDSDSSECQPYFVSARTFATAMSIPLIVYVRAQRAQRRARKSHFQPDRASAKKSPKESSPTRPSERKEEHERVISNPTELALGATCEGFYAT
jgi:hypothetical protein